MPTITFDGPNTIIEIGYDTALTTTEAAAIYSAWKAWVVAGNEQYLPAFSESVGGNALGGGSAISAYLFLNTGAGWRIRPADQDYTLKITGDLYPAEAGVNMFLNRVGRNIQVQLELSSKSQVVAGTGLTAEDVQEIVNKTVIPHIWAAS